MATLAEIRAQYPQYSDMPDAALADALYKKFYSDLPRADFEAKIGLKAAPAPSSDGIPTAPRRTWGDVPGEALSNLPASAKRFAGGIFEAVTSPVQTVKNVAQLAGGAAYAMLPQTAQDWLISNANDPEKVKQSIAMAKAVGGEYARRYGTEEGFKEALATDPVGVASDFSTILSGGAAITAKAAPTVSKALSTAATYTNPLSPVVSVAKTISQPNVLAPAQPAANALAQGKAKLGEATTGMAANVTGAISGKPGAAYREAFKAGKAGDVTFLDNLRGNVAPDDLLTTVQQGIDKMRADKSAAYATAKTGWAADKTALDFGPIDDAYQKVKSSLVVNGKSKIGAAEQKIVDEIGAVLDEWRNDPAARTTLDLDALKQRIDAIYPESPKHTQAQRAVTEVRNAVKDTIVNQAPDYAQAMKDYDVQMTLLRDIQKGLSTGDKASKEAAINKLMGSLKSKPSSDFRRQLIDAIEQQGGVNIMPAIAGQELGQWVPSSGVGRAVMGGGLTTAAALRHPELALAVPLASPRLMGEAYYKMGQAAGGGKRAVNALSRMTPEEIAYINALTTQNQRVNEQRNALAK